MGRFGNKFRAMRAVTFVETRTGTPLDVCRNFRDWTTKNKIKSYVDIAEMLHVTNNEAKRLLDLAALPDDVTIKRMKELMNRGV